MFVDITEKMFVKLAGELGTEIVRRRREGTAWLLPDGRAVFEMKADIGWRYVLANV